MLLESLCITHSNSVPRSPCIAISLSLSLSLSLFLVHHPVSTTFPRKEEKNYNCYT